MVKKKILLLGATGMAGHVAYYYLRSLGKYDILNVAFRTKLAEDTIIVDVTDHVKIDELIRSEKPDIILNCVGVLIRGSKEQPDNAIYINAYFPHLLKKISDEIDCKVIHISTDCVFSGKQGNYTEKDFRDADDLYGRSKALGELINDSDLTIRTSIVGPELKKNGEGLFHWFMNQCGVINGYTKAVWGGVTTLELAKAIDKSIDHNLTGLVHLSNGMGIPKYDLLCLFQTIWGKNNVIIKEYVGDNINKSIAKSVSFDFAVPDYREMLQQQYEWMRLHKFLYDSIYV